MEEEYSVWALPPPEARNRIKDLMRVLRSEFGGPEFDPHISLTRESASRHLKSASETLSPFTARVSAVSGRHLIFESTPQVMEVSARCCGYFGFKYSRPYTPRSSLLYGELTEEKNERVQKRVLELDQEIVGFTFEVSEIGLAETDTEDKSLKSWEIVEIMKLY
ncbi:cyclic phosphodiesterase-like [Asparagus officinalis]|uniref:cyclic phosphodiesterase-like n=1 Tax=Asparagus officinalis TaxID=4686 RepID=UPI00098E2796|nr:cyclic phosphodiesterase-like [Asparagus officinalis]